MDSFPRSPALALLLLLVLLPSSSIAQFAPSPSPDSDSSLSFPPSPSPDPDLPAFSPAFSPDSSFDDLSPFPSPDDLSPFPSPDVLSPFPSPDVLSPFPSPPQDQPLPSPSPSPFPYDDAPLDPSLASDPTVDNAAKRHGPTVSQKAGIVIGLFLSLFVVGLLTVVCKKRRDNIRRSHGLLLNNNKYGQLHGRSVQMTEV